MPINSYKFGELNDKTITLYTLTNVNGMEVKITDYGATITSITIPDGRGGRAEMAAGFDLFENYLVDAYSEKAVYFGGTVGRYASRIKNGQFTVEGETYQVTVNDGSNHLHGGKVGFDKRQWKSKEIEIKDAPALSFTLVSPDLEEGYPGEVIVTVIFILTDENEIIIDYYASVSKTTPLSLTNHTYFNLSGFASTIHDHQVTILADKLLLPDDTNVQVGETIGLDNHPDDFRGSVLLADVITSKSAGIENYYAFDHNERSLREVAVFAHPPTNRTLKISTTEPGALFYTGYFTNDRPRIDNGLRYGRDRGFCFKTSRFPNGPNLPDAVNALTTVGNPYKSRTVYGFKW